MNKLSKISTISLTAVSLSLLFSTAAFAVGPSSQPSGRPSNVGQPSARPSLPSQATSNLEGAKLRACQARENAIKTRSTHLVQLVTSMESKFDAITKRVEDYYTSKVVPSGKTISNYNVLVSDIKTKKAAVQTVLTQAQNDASGFSCTGSDPRLKMTQFRDDMQAVKKALKDYRTSVKNLIVAVHSVQSPRPSRLPNQGGNRP